MNSKLKLWHRAVFLFHRADAPGWVGPFKEAGYEDYRVEYGLMTDEGKKLTPDIVAEGDEYWSIFELTTGQSVKDGKLEEYQQLRPEGLTNIGLDPKPQGPVCLVGRSEHLPHEESPQIILGESLDGQNLEDIDDSGLESSLIQSIGRPLDEVPDISFTIIPECSSEEVREGLVPVIVSLFNPDRPTMSTVDMAEKALERLADKVPITEKESLATRIEHELEGLLNGQDPHLSEYLEETGDGFHVLESVKIHPNTLQKVREILEAWIEGPTRLDDFVDED